MRTCYVDEGSRSIADLCDYYGKGMLLTRINVPQPVRGRGHARDLLARILRDADEEGVTLYLEILPSGGLTYYELEGWYLRAGFRCVVEGFYRRKPQKRSSQKRP